MGGHLEEMQLAREQGCGWVRMTRDDAGRGTG